MIYDTSYNYLTCKLDHNSRMFELPTLSVMSEENGCHVNMVSVLTCITDVLMLFSVACIMNQDILSLQLLFGCF